MLIKICLLFIFILCFYQQTYAEKLELFTDNRVYTKLQPLFVYGNALPNENLIIRLFYPDGTIAKFDQIESDLNGLFNHILLIWPSPSQKFPYGTYTIEVTSTEQNGFSKKANLRFSSTSGLVIAPVKHQISTFVFVPELAAIDNLIRIFIQITSDGMLVGDDPNKLLGTSHVHMPSGKVVSLYSEFNTLHQGLYFADYTPEQEGTYVFHIVTFNSGTISHSSAATTVLSQDIGGISDQIMELDLILDDASKELDKLQYDVSKFGTTLETASNNIDKSVLAISKSVNNIEEASIQLNSLLFPIVAFIVIIVVLQIAILARYRK